MNDCPWDPVRIHGLKFESSLTSTVTNMRDILYTLALDANDQLVNAVDAVKGQLYYCPECKGEMVSCRSTVQKKGAKRPHYAHRVKNPNCEPESVLHWGFKKLLATRIQGHLDTGEILPIKWRCDTCDAIHADNLLKKAVAVAEELPLGPCQPDIALLDGEGEPVWALEVVVTHQPEEQALEHYRSNHISLARFDLKSDQDLDKATALTLEPDVVDQCTTPRCPTCHRFQRKTWLWVIQAGCWKCGCTMPIAVVEGSDLRGGSTVGPEGFTDEELRIARERGCLIKEQYSRTQGRKYLANSCKECGAFAGQFHMFSQYFAPAAYGELESEKISTGLYCEHCDAEAVENLDWNSEELDAPIHDAKTDDDPDQVEHSVIAPFIPDSQKSKEGFCIRCRTPLVRNRRKPLCSECFYHERIREDMGGDPPEEQQFCHRCGERHPSTRWKPYCRHCFFIAG